ncbi:N-acetylglucosamine-6-phosphate deacetylase [candidate division KSB1 bacterium]
MGDKLLIKNCRVITPVKAISESDILIVDGKIKGLGIFDNEDCITINGEGRTAAPGFIDIHMQGAGGFDMLDGTYEALSTIAKTSARFGVTGFLGTTVYRPNGDNSHLMTAAEYTGKDLGGAELLGVHIEGPFISQEKRGMIQPDSIGETSLETLDEIYSLTGDSLKMMTIAPELDGSLEIIKQLVKGGITASFGHSAASFEDTIKGIEAGINHVTHIYNAMMPITHRNPGPLPAIFKNSSITAQVIFDGIHIHPSVLKFSSRLLGEKRVVIITDGVQSMGLKDGKYMYNNVEFTSYNGTARYSDGTLIGTCMGMNELIEKYIIYTGGSLRRAVRAASLNPACVIGINDKKGSIKEGKDADIVILNKDLSVWKTIKDGEIIYGEE